MDVTTTDNISMRISPQIPPSLPVKLQISNAVVPSHIAPKLRHLYSHAYTAVSVLTLLSAAVMLMRLGKRVVRVRIVKHEVAICVYISF